jgi:FkbM family methyltransferase
MTISRKEFLMGLGGAALAAPLGVLAGRSQSGTSGSPAPPSADESNEPGVRSYAQGGEDVAAHFLFDYLGHRNITYLDIGAYDPILINNTYFFYRRGHRGVLVEPNVAMCQKLRAVRPEDVTLEAGIGVTAEREADYYVMTEPSWNTFSREEAEHQTRATQGKVRIERVIKMPLLNINDVIAEHLRSAPSFLSIDAEGLHLAILQSLDYRRFRPLVICVETLVSGTRQTIREIPEFLATQGYVPRGGSLANTLFVDSNRL